VRFAGRDVREAAQAEVRERVAIVDQDAHLFTTTLRENVRLARPAATDEEISAALGTAGLGDWLAELPDGLDTLVGEQGGLVSGGERRRIALARGLLSEAPVLVLDEPSAHLDAAASERLLAALARDTGDRTVVVVTHAAAGLDAYDRVVKLADGALA
jgi:ABC-type transport system involved in cytochrome bd biosynthesis fused ATPase/permease subunit